MIEFRVGEPFLDILGSRIGAIAKQAARIENRLGITLPVPVMRDTGKRENEIIPGVRDDFTGEQGQPAVRVWAFVEIDYPEPLRAPGWRFLAVVEHTDKGNIIRGVNVPEDIELRDFYHGAAKCDHCGVDRYRKDTYLVLHVATGNVKEVGSTCLKDYTGGLDPAACAAQARWMDQVLTDLGEYGSDDYDGWYGAVTRGYWPDAVYTQAAAQIREHGYKKAWEYDEYSGRYHRNDGDCTVDDVKDCIEHPQKGEDRFAHVTDDDVVTARLARDWAEALIDADREFDHSMGVIACMDLLAKKDLGLACYTIEAHRRFLVKQAQDALTPDIISGHVGTLGSKGFSGEVTVVEADAPVDGDYGMSYRTSMATSDGYKLVWYKSNEPWEKEIGDKLNIVAFVKAHKAYKDGFEYTAINRVKIID